jgi:hypothetical protein
LVTKRRVFILNQDDTVTDFAARRSNIPAQLDIKGYQIPLLFPTLYPGGCGGPGEWRQVRLSLTEHVLRTLRLPHLRFQQHPAYSLVLFDKLATNAAFQKLYYVVNMKATATIAGQITTDEAAIALQYADDIRKAQKQGIRPPEVPESIKNILDVQRGIKIGAGAYFGSDSQRANARRQALAFLKWMGVPHLFITLTPDPAGTYSIAIKSGKMSEEAVKAGNRLLLLNRADRRIIANENPYLQAVNALHVRDVFIKTFLGWNVDAGMPIRNGGYLGVVRWFMGTVEAQKNMDLHFHMVVALNGLPQTGKDLLRKIDQNSVFGDAFYRYLRTIMSPTTKLDDPTNTCPLVDKTTNDRCRGTLQSLPIPIEAYRRIKNGETYQIPLARCDLCEEEFEYTEVIRYRIQNATTLWHELHPQEQLDTSEAIIDEFICTFPEIRRQPRFDNAIHSTHVVLKQQTHYKYHSASCFKVSKITIIVAFKLCLLNVIRIYILRLPLLLLMELYVAFSHRSWQTIISNLTNKIISLFLSVLLETSMSILVYRLLPRYFRSIPIASLLLIMTQSIAPCIPQSILRSHNPRIKCELCF